MIAGALFLCAVSVLGWTFHLQWFEWIERPRLWREVMGSLDPDSFLGPDESRGGALNPAMEGKLHKLLSRQIPLTTAAPWRSVFFQRLPLIGPRQAWVASGNVDSGDDRTGIHAAVFDDAGRVIPGAPEPVPFSWELDQVATMPGFVGFRSIAAGDGCAALFEVGPERLTPRGLHLLLKPNLAVPVSWRVSRSAWGWLAGSESALAAPERIARELEASSPQVILSALADLELYGPELAVLAVPVLGSSRPFLRARAAAILANDPHQEALLIRLLDDPEREVRLAAALGLLHSSDRDTAQAGLVCILKYEPHLLTNSQVDLARSRALEVGSKAVAILLDQDPAGWADEATPLSEVWAQLLPLLKPDAVRPSEEEILRQWREELARWPQEPDSARWHILTTLVARLQTPQADAALLGPLKHSGEQELTREILGPLKRSGELELTRTMVQDRILEALIARRHPLQVPQALEAIDSLVEGRLDRVAFLKRVWSEPWSIELAAELEVMCPLYQEDRGLWPRDPFAPEAIRRALTRFLERSHPAVDLEMAKFLSQQPASSLAPAATELCAFWRSVLAEGVVPFIRVRALGRCGTPEADTLLADLLGSSRIEEAEIRDLLESLLLRESPPSAALLQALEALLSPAATGTIDAELAAGVQLVRARWSESTDTDQLGALTRWLTKLQTFTRAEDDSQSVSTRARELLRALNLVLRAPREDRLGLIEVLWSHLWRSPWTRSD